MSDEEKMAQLEAHPWFQARPPKVQEAIRRYPPHRRYRQKTTNYVCSIYSVDEDADGNVRTCTVIIRAADNRWAMTLQWLGDRRVFGVALDNLEMLDA